MNVQRINTGCFFVTRHTLEAALDLSGHLRGRIDNQQANRKPR
jgi:hypothetical protein